MFVFVMATNAGDKTEGESLRWTRNTAKNPVCGMKDDSLGVEALNRAVAPRKKTVIADWRVCRDAVVGSY